MLPMEGIGVVFDIDELGGGFYGAEAWRIFMRSLSPSSIVNCILQEGDTNETLFGRQEEFCIGVFGLTLNAGVVKAAFADSSDKGLAAPDRRFIASPQVNAEPLVTVGAIDHRGRLVQDEWSRSFHDRCTDCGWGYAPERVTVDLTPELTSELDVLRNK